MPADLAALMDTAAGACEYAEARRVARRTERLRVRNGAVERVEARERAGIGIRVRVGGAWGFAATDDLAPPAAERALARALAVARDLPRTRATPLTPVHPASGRWSGPVAEDPFALSLDDKLALLVAASEALRTDARIVRADAGLISEQTETAFASTEGAKLTQARTECAAGLQAVAVEGDEVQVRSYPAAHEGGAGAAGFELVRSLRLAEEAPRVADEALALLTAPVCPAGRHTVVLDGDQVALQVHESVGHALELDRILLGEASYAGTSWVPVSGLGSLRYGSPAMHVTADATLPGGLGSFGWDDEGVPAQRTALVTEGILRGVLSSRESAAAIGLPASGGCARAEGHDRQPIVRMTNVSLEPGEAGTLADLIADTGEGLYLETNRSWSIDDRRLNFQFGTEVAREITGGTLGRLYRNAAYAGTTPRFWAGLDAVCSAPAWRLHGVMNCGKGEPGQVAHVSHGAAPARFRDVEAGPA